MSAMENKVDVRSVLLQASKLVESGSWDEAIRLLTESNRLEENERIETQLIKLRHLSFDEIEKPVPTPIWPIPVPDHFPNESKVPEIPASELSVELVTSAIQYHGSIIVRGLFDSEACGRVRHSIDAAFAAAEAVAGQKEFAPSPWYTHFVPQRRKGYNFGGMERHFVTRGAGVLGVDSPRALFRYIDCLVDAGFEKFLHEYFGERPALSAKKTTFRHTPPDTPTGWHQDGGYFRTQVRALNLWAAFSPCGIRAPSIDIFAKRFDYIVEQLGPDKTRVTDESAARCGAEHIVRTEFEPGDALLFDEMALHQTGVDQFMTEYRYAVEMWFFAASMFPRDQVPLYL